EHFDDRVVFGTAPFHGCFGGVRRVCGAVRGNDRHLGQLEPVAERLAHGAAERAGGGPLPKAEREGQGQNKMCDLASRAGFITPSPSWGGGRGEGQFATSRRRTRPLPIALVPKLRL